MLDTIVIGLLILSALVYGFWQYYAEPDNVSEKRKSKHKNKLFKIIFENIQKKNFSLHVFLWSAAFFYSMTSIPKKCDSFSICASLHTRELFHE